MSKSIKIIIFIISVIFLLLIFGTVATEESEIIPIYNSDASIIMLDSSFYEIKKEDTVKNVDIYEVKYENKQKGEASWYGPGFQGRKTANGERYNMYEENLYTAAHKSLPFNTILKVTRISTGKHIFVRINDRGPYIRGRIIDLNKSAKLELMNDAGTTNVIIEQIKIYKNDTLLTFEEMCEYLINQN